MATRRALFIVWEMLTVTETEGAEPIARVVASVMTGVKFNLITDTANAICDLIMALKYKTKFYNEKSDNDVIKTLNMVYNRSFDVVMKSLHNGDFPDEVTEKVCDVIYE